MSYYLALTGHHPHGCQSRRVSRKVPRIGQRTLLRGENWVKIRVQGGAYTACTVCMAKARTTRFDFCLSKAESLKVSLINSEYIAIRPR